MPNNYIYRVLFMVEFISLPYLLCIFIYYGVLKTCLICTLDALKMHSEERKISQIL